jgi:hypothetical protein
LGNETKKEEVRENKNTGRPAYLPDDEFLAQLKARPIYEGLDVDLERGKAESWWAAKGLGLSRHHLVNWLNRAVDGKRPGGGPVAAGSHQSEISRAVANALRETQPARPT